MIKKIISTGGMVCTLVLPAQADCRQCADNFNNQTTAAAATYNSCVDNARRTFGIGSGGIGATAGVTGALGKATVATPWLGMVALSLAMVSETSSVTFCGETYDNAIKAAENTYRTCMRYCGT